MSPAAARPSSHWFFDAMARVCTPVSVVTTFDQIPHGTTVSAFASLSLAPPMVLVALDERSELLARMSQTGRFGVNVLSSSQADLALRFAKKGADDFAGLTWYPEDGCPRLGGAAVWLACEVAELVEGGDHRVAFGHVSRSLTDNREPLTYHARAFGTHAPAPSGRP